MKRGEMTSDRGWMTETGISEGGGETETQKERATGSQGKGGRETESGGKHQSWG